MDQATSNKSARGVNISLKDIWYILKRSHQKLKVLRKRSKWSWIILTPLIATEHVPLPIPE